MCTQTLYPCCCISVVHRQSSWPYNVAGKIKIGSSDLLVELTPSQSTVIFSSRLEPTFQVAMNQCNNFTSAKEVLKQAKQPNKVPE